MHIRLPRDNELTCMNIPSNLIAQCIEVGKKTIPNLANPLAPFVTPGSFICGPFPTKDIRRGVVNPCPTGNCFETPGDVISRVMEYAFPFAGIILLVMIIWAGYDFVMSRGETSKIESATKKITYALVGFGILIVSYVVVKTVSYILGFDSPI